MVSLSLRSPSTNCVPVVTRGRGLPRMEGEEIYNMGLGFSPSNY